MIVSINQPCYLGWMGYFDRIAKSDLHIVLDHVQFEKGSFTNRTRIRQRDGRMMWLTVPIENPTGKPIDAIQIATSDWERKHRVALTQAYGNPEWIWDRAIDPPGSALIGLLVESTDVLLDELGIDTPIAYSHSLGATGRKSELVLNLCKEVGATHYLSWPLGRDYLDLPAFDKAGIEVLWHDYKDPDDPPLSAIHHLFNGSTPMWQESASSSAS